jgi:hypothetical protein
MVWDGRCIELWSPKFEVYALIKQRGDSYRVDADPGARHLAAFLNHMRALY